MRNVMLTAVREYKATAMTKAFIFGVVIFPVLIIGLIWGASISGIFRGEAPRLEGTIAIADALPGQPIAADAPDLVQLRLDRMIDEAKERAKQATGDGPNSAMAEAIIENQLGGVIRYESLPADVDAEAQKQRVREGELVAFVQVGPEALQPGSGFELIHSPSLKTELIGAVRGGFADAIVNTRVREAGYDPGEVRALMAAPEARTTTVTETGEAGSNEIVQKLVPVVFMFLLWTAVFTGGQYLLMSTIEEKSSRVMEVLLSACTPMQLMSGKILGQGLVGLTILAMYGGAGLLAAGQFDILELIPLSNLVWLGVYFVMAYFMIAAMMAAIGSAVTEMREAQSLMGPIMTILMLPLFVWFLIMDNPNSVFSRVTSFFPPTTPFVMTLRLSQTGHEVPMWEIIATTIVGFAGVIFLVWAAAKIFRLGVLMYGKPPTLLGLLKWLRYS